MLGLFFMSLEGVFWCRLVPDMNLINPRQLLPLQDVPQEFRKPIPGDCSVPLYARRGFCPGCGSPLIFQYEGTLEVWVPTLVLTNRAIAPGTQCTCSTNVVAQR
jgi:hypothetical protein